MKKLTPQEQDALREICNVGMSKAAAQLSKLLNVHIDIMIPEINVVGLQTQREMHLFPEEQLLSYAYQTLSGDLSGRALLIFQKTQTHLLTQAVIGTAPELSEKEIRACEQEALLEIGNIIITSCMSAITNMLTCQAQLDVPKYDESHIRDLLEAQADELNSKEKDIIVIETKLDASGRDIAGILMLMLTEDSVNKLYDYLKRLLGTV